MSTATPTAPAESPGRLAPLGAGYRQGMLQTFGTTDGLPSVIVHDLLVDGEGRLWVATLGGLCCFDGHQLRAFTAADGLPANPVWSLAWSPSGDIWAGTEAGLVRYDGRGFITYTTADGLAHDRVGSLLQMRSGDLWCGAGGFDPGSPCGLTRYDGQRFTAFTASDGLPHEQVWSLCETRDGVLWVGTANGLARLTHGRFELHPDLPVQDGDDLGPWLPGRLAPGLVNAILEDRHGSLWVGTRAGLYRGDHQSMEPVPIGGGALAANVRDLAEAGDGAIWLATWAGVCRCDGSEVTPVCDVRDGLGNNQVNAVVQDGQGDIWAGTLSGLTRYCAGQFAQFTERDGLASDLALCVAEECDGAIWLGTMDGVSCFDSQGLRPLAAMRGRHVATIVEDGDGRLWFGGMHGLSRWDGDECITLGSGQGFPGHMIQCSCRDAEGHLWFGTPAGLYRWDGRGFEASLQDQEIYTVGPDAQGRLWVRTGDAIGIFRDGHLDIAEAVTTHAINHTPFTDSRGTLWYTSGDGGTICRRGDERRCLTRSDGFTDSFVPAVFEDRRGHLWFSTYGEGVIRYDGTVFQSLTRRDGLAHHAVQQALEDRRGDVWITTEGGVTRYRPREVCPHARICSVVADRRYEPESVLHLVGPVPLVAFEFEGTSATTPTDRMVYVVRLIGLDETWIPRYEARAEYQDLPTGEYTFQVRAVDADLNYSAVAEVQLAVEDDPRIAAFNEALGTGGLGDDFVGDSPALRHVQMQLREVAATDATVLIEGETGTGKGLAARVLHSLSGRRAGPLVHVHCGALPESLVESELFGHERGAFTGAVARKIGKAELASGGTLFLDEIGDMPLSAQVKLLRLLEERTFERVGGTHTLSADVRIAAATNRDLAQMVREGTFREDLYYRLQVFPVRLPPLRDRRQDIALLALYFMQHMAAHLGKSISAIAPEACARLEAYDWPGNVRELEHAVQRAAIVCSGSAIEAGDLAIGSDTSPAAGAEGLTLEQSERRYILATLERTGWVVRGPRGAAAILGVHEATLRSKMKKLGITRPSA